MQVPTHLAISWLIGHRLPERRDRRLVTWAGVLPDLDALSLLGGAGAFSEYHHVLTHGLVHVHLLCDLLGSGRDWPIIYFYPFSRHEFYTPYGWPLASPQNTFVWLAAVALTVWIGITRGRTFAEAFLPARADAAVVKALRDIYARFKPRGSGTEAK
jgi:membrane-bound metal-dependent hydrolase YbcI (DUF457 family)